MQIQQFKVKKQDSEFESRVLQGKTTNSLVEVFLKRRIFRPIIWRASFAESCFSLRFFRLDKS
jgi:hypothetical protein